MRLFVSFMKSESGASAIEYGLIAVLIAVAIVVAVNTLGTTLNASYTTTSNVLK